MPPRNTQRQAVMQHGSRPEETSKDPERTNHWRDSSGKVGHYMACKEKRVKGESKKSREPPYIGFPLYPLQRRRRDLTGHAVADFTFSEAL